MTSVEDMPEFTAMASSYNLPDGRKFDNQHDAEIALKALRRVRWADATCWGDSTYRYIVVGIDPIEPEPYFLPRYRPED